jgi:hypothetical protein
MDLQHLQSAALNAMEASGKQAHASNFVQVGVQAQSLNMNIYR